MSTKKQTKKLALVDPSSIDSLIKLYEWRNIPLGGGKKCIIAVSKVGAYLGHSYDYIISKIINMSDFDILFPYTEEYVEPFVHDSRLLSGLSSLNMDKKWGVSIEGFPIPDADGKYDTLRDCIEAILAYPVLVPSEPNA